MNNIHARARRRRLVKALAAVGIVAVSTGGLVESAHAATPVVVQNDLLTVTGTAGNDTIFLVLQDPNTVAIDFGADGTADFTADRSQFTAILVKGLGGNDTITASTNGGAFTDTELTTFDGGGGNDTLIGSTGGETLKGGAGNDFMDGNIGADSLDGGGGNDVIQWDPGDGSDVVNGGAGQDRLAFNGSNASELMDFSAVADHVRFTRNVGAVVQDLDSIEAVDLRALGGTDGITVNDLTGTDLKEINTDLAAFGGADDGLIDEVVVPVTSPVTWTGAVAVAQVRGTRVNVVNGSPSDRVHLFGTAADDVASVDGTSGPDVIGAAPDLTDAVVFRTTPGVQVRLTNVEHLDVDLGDGDDSFVAQNGLGSRTLLDVDGGKGNDTIAGADGADLLNGGDGNDFLDGNIGADHVLGGTGNDVVQWDPGDGSDVLDGGSGQDRLAFNGSNIGELMDVSANGDHVRFTRNVGAIVLDIDNIESLDVRTLGGIDSVTVNNLTGTDLKAVSVDIAGFGGVDDGSVDDVVVNGTAGDDRFAIRDEGAAVVAQRLSFSVRITGANPTADRLTVNGLQGTDSFTVTPGASALILLNLVS